MNHTPRAAILTIVRISTYPEVNFTVIVNPHNGPGATPIPDRNYTSEIPKLTAHRNVRVLGYVATTYATRDVNAVLQDVDTYSAWSTHSSIPGLSVNGIFFDETPMHFNHTQFDYLEQLYEAVKRSSGLGPDNYVCYQFVTWRFFPPASTPFLP